MPNTTPIPELIAIELQERLREITKANGYAFNVAEVVRPNRRGDNWRYEHNGLAILQGTSERIPELDCPGNPPALAYRTTYEVRCICRDSANASYAHATNENQMAAAVVKAITAEDQWYTMDDNAFDTDIGSAEPIDSPDGEFDGVTVPIIVSYRISEDDPFEVRA